MELKVLLIGDIVGKPGRKALNAFLPGFLRSGAVDFVIANGENAARGSGITEKIFTEITSSGVNVVTMGDHVWRRKDIITLLHSRSNLLRPANLPARCPGVGARVFTTSSGISIGVATVVGRIFMNPAEHPFAVAEKEIALLREKTSIIFLEVHAEATSEKIALGWKFAGRVSCVFGTHTHVPTADETILPGGTAYITDIGMTGPHKSVIGRDIEKVLFQFETQMHAPFEIAHDDVRISGAIVVVDTETGQACSIERVQFCVEIEQGK